MSRHSNAHENDFRILMPPGFTRWSSPSTNLENLLPPASSSFFRRFGRKKEVENALSSS
jgi:hypothetical protein